MRTISINKVEYAFSSARNIQNKDVQSQLAGCHQRADSRPLCNCVPLGIPLQVKRINGIYHLARMPAQGLQHSTDCEFHGEIEAHVGQAKQKNVDLAFSINTDKPSEASSAGVTLQGLFNHLWVQAGLHNWSKNQKLKSWSEIAKRLYLGVSGMKLAKVPVSQLLWVLPNLDETQTSNLRDDCLNFVRACNANGHYALVVAPIGTSEFIKERGSMQIRFRNVDKPPVFIPYNKFCFNTGTLKEPGDSPYPVAMMIVKASPDKPYLIAKDITMLWMATGYIPCTTKYHSKVIAELMGSVESFSVCLDTMTGEIGAVIARAKYRFKENSLPIRSNETIRQYPWTPHDKT